VGTWLRCLPPHLSPLLFEVRHEDRLVALALLGRHRRRRHGVLVSNGLFLSESGDPRYDCLTVEHNGLLVERASRDVVMAEAMRGLASLGLAWDELFLGGIAGEDVQPYLLGAQRCGIVPLVKVRKPYHFVDCAAVRESGRDYLDALSSNTRYQIRRAMRSYLERGALQVQVAQTLDEAQACFSKLSVLHQQYWLSRGQRGAFANEFASDFHRNLIASRFRHGEIQLVEIRAGASPIGYLYNFAFGGVVSNYQSGFAYEKDARLKPGLVSHCCAIQHSVADGARIYDLLMGEQRYKQSLATHHGEMAWLVLQKPRLRFRIERLAARCRTQLSSIAQRPAQPDAAMGVEQ
jgi:CelD/BcsL family acetyltransferase involved in cellulose biosynthesis